jgi:hypothetical protein
MKNAYDHKKPSSDRLLLHLTFAILLALHAIFLWATFLPDVLPAFIKAIDQTLDTQRPVVMIAELFGAAVLFVDMVTRFDELHPKRKVWHVVAVAFFGLDWIFQLFVYFLDSALSMT